MDEATGSSPEAGATGAWDPPAYLRFAGERARPFVDLLARVRAAAPRAVVDMGCGTGALTASLGARWPGAEVTGVDSSPEMLAAAAAHAVPEHVRFVAGDVRDWAPAGPVDVLVSNAVLHWVPGHERLLQRWAAWLAPGGELAVQVPGNFRAPTHAALAALCRSPRWAPALADVAPDPDAVLDPAGYLDVLTGDDPVLGWVRSTVLRPVLARLDEPEASELTAAYAADLREDYPPRPDGTTVLPFRRVFAVAARPA